MLPVERQVSSLFFYELIDLIHKTEMNRILERKWARKRALEMLARTGVGKRIIRKAQNKKVK
ncbi:MAG TPA: hypothetical protein VLB50_13800 [Ignavibacteriaceae bacterium]|nr:hypothetical protein [Ignavibacteriaceae bacterium]